MNHRLTVTIDAKLLVKARATAAEIGMSLKQFANELLAKVRRQRHSSDIAKRRALERLRVGLDLPWTPSLFRDDSH